MERRTLLTAAVVGSLLVAVGGTVYAAAGRGGASTGTQAAASAQADSGASSAPTPPAARPGWRDDENDDDGIRGRRDLGGRGHLAEAATYLGLTPRELVAELFSGKTLAEVAGAQGKSVAGLEETLVQSERSELESAVAAGMLTETQASELLDERRSRVDELVHGRYGLGRSPEGDHDHHDGPPSGTGDPI